MSNVNSAVDAVFEEAANFFKVHLQKEVRITSINQDALNLWKSSWANINNRQPPNGGWDWNFKFNEASRKFSKCLISVAVWGENNSLCGLAICSKSKGNKVLSMHYIEGAPDEGHPLKGYVFNIINAILLEYASLIKANKIRIMQPVNGLKYFYDSRGYSLSKKSLFGREYCERGIQR